MMTKRSPYPSTPPSDGTSVSKRRPSPLRALLALAASVVLLSACGPKPTAKPRGSSVGSVDDPHSYANIAEVTVSHLDLDLDVDFDAKRLSGTATLTLADAGAERLVLDTRDLEIESVVLDDTGTVAFTLGDDEPYLGRPLEIPLGPRTRTVAIRYSTSPDAGALQWLSPEQTAGGTSPFLFSQSQANLARTWVPCQDSPAVRMTYEATLRVPPELLALMSAENGTVKSEDGIYRFSMRQPIPSYLLALAVGDLEFRELGPRTGVYAEPSVIERAAWEFADTEQMMTAAERLYGPYPWGRYDLLVLPPSFPFGGMENPRLTFATPTILAGDRSLVSLVAHELAHSWSGNLVTNATWNDFWLNEGFTSYIENRLMEELYGREYAEMLAVLGLAELRQSLLELGPDSPDSRLVVDLEGRNPDDGMSDVAYEKGANFLRALEFAVGRERFDRFLNDYFSAFAFQSIDTATFVDFLRRHLLSENPSLETRVRVEDWIYGPGLPDSLVEFEPEEFAGVEETVSLWAGGQRAVTLDTKGWTTHHWLHFLRSLPDELTIDAMTELDESFGFTESGNSEVLFAWLMLSVRHDYEAARPALERFLTGIGRLKFLYPLYAALAEDDSELEWARAVYAQARSGYHPVSITALDRLLGKDDAESPSG